MNSVGSLSDCMSGSCEDRRHPSRFIKGTIYSTSLEGLHICYDKLVLLPCNKVLILETTLTLSILHLLQKTLIILQKDTSNMKITKIRTVVAAISDVFTLTNAGSS